MADVARPQAKPRRKTRVRLVSRASSGESLQVTKQRIQILTKRQQQAHQMLGFGATYNMLVGGSRSGKTFLFMRALLMRALRAAESRHAIFRLRYNALKASIVRDTLPKVVRICFPALVGKLVYRMQEGYVLLPNQAEIWFCGLDDKERTEKVLGMEFVTVYFNECSQIPYASVLLALTRLAQLVEELETRAYFDLNPTGTSHWTYRLFIELVDPVSRLPLEDVDDYVHMYMNPVDNAEHIDPKYIKLLKAMPERQRRRFLEGKYIAEIDGALWTCEVIARQRIDESERDAVLRKLRRIVVAVDPSGCSGDEDKRSDEIGIVVVGMDDAAPISNCYVLMDATCRDAPERWASKVAVIAKQYGADVVAEKNFGGDMVRAVLQANYPKLNVTLVTASRGKMVRAEPVSSLYAANDANYGGRGYIYHVGEYPRLEDEMCNFSTAGYQGEKSPNRADALVWGVTHLMLGDSTNGLFELMRQLAEQAQQEQKAA